MKRHAFWCPGIDYPIGACVSQSLLRFCWQVKCGVASIEEEAEGKRTSQHGNPGFGQKAVEGQGSPGVKCSAFQEFESNRI